MSAEATPPADGAPAGGKKPIMLILALVVGLAAGGAAGALAVGPALAAGIAPTAVESGLHAKKSAHKAAADDAEDEEHGDAEGDEEEDEEGGEEGEAKEHEGKEGEAAAATVHVVDNLVLNPAASGGTRFLLVTVAFDMKTAALAEQVKARDAEVRDAVLGTLGGKSVEQLSDPAQREAIKTELQAVVGKLVKKKKGVRRIYFPQFVIQ